MNQNLYVALICLSFTVVFCNESPIFSHDMNNFVISENTSVGTIIYTLQGYDPENSSLHFGIEGTDHLTVDRNTGEVKLIKPFDREVNDSLRFIVTLEDEVEGVDNNVVKLPVSIIIDDINDNAPIFIHAPYEISVNEDTQIGTTIFRNIKVEDIDLIGDPLEVTCASLEISDVCQKFKIVVLNSNESYFEGSIVLNEILNYNEKQLHQLKLIAFDGKFKSSTICDIRVLDVQNLPPVFQSSLTAIVQEDAAIGTRVITLQAKDGDRGIPRNIVYDLITNPFDYFQLDRYSGELRTAKPLDREKLVATNGVLSLKVKAREVTNRDMDDDELTSAIAEVSITIRDVNDEAPKFDKSEYYVIIPENLPEGSPLPNLNMIVTDTDIGNSSAYSLRLAEDVSGAFVVEPTKAMGSTAVIIRLTNNSLDFENPNQRKFILLVVAEETETAEHLSSTSTLTIEVTDTNDNPPKFENPTYTAVINESSLPGTIVTTITATDRDSDVYGEKSIVYELISDGFEKFNVGKKTGIITVASCNSPGIAPCLDYETKTTYFLTYKATDKEGYGQSASVPLKIMVIDNNDNAPFFKVKNYITVIEEGATKFEPSFFVKAEDADKTSTISYSIKTDEVEELFDINPNTGEILILSHNGIFRNNSDLVSFVVKASDGTFSSETVVNVKILDVNNNEPEFALKNYFVKLPEDTKLGTEILKVSAVDKDSERNAELTYRIEKGAFNDFNISSINGSITVASKLDYDKRNVYNITIIATDGGTPMLTGTTKVNVHILNTNDKDPFFEPVFQRAEIAKDAEIGTKFYKMLAFDLDTNDTKALNFAFSEPITAVDKHGKDASEAGNNAFKKFFDIEPDTGEVFVANTLQRDVASVITLRVIVTDVSANYPQRGKGTLLVSILDVNDIPPEFSLPWTKEKPYYIKQLQEEVPIGTILTTFTATDSDSDIHHYAIEPDSEYFAVNETTGTVITKKRIDFEEIQSINFTLVAYDMGEPQLSSSANVIVNIINLNDMNPVFEKTEYEGSVKENSPVGTSVLKVTATDSDLEDFGKIRYHFKKDYVDNFVIEEYTGIIKVANSATLDREKISEVLLNVEASDTAPSDEKRSAIVPVKIKIEDVNDNPPVFIQHQYSANIVETISYSPPTPIVQLHAEDKDDKSRLRYTIVNGNDEEAFHLDFNTGILYPKRSLLGILKQFKLTVEVTDGRFTDKAVIDVNVLDVNQNKPLFQEPSSSNASVLIPENAKVNYMVMKVFAEDKDPGENGRVTYHFKVGNNVVQSTDEFHIDENTGELRTLVSLDRERKSTYQLILIARDHGTQTTYETFQFLTIILKDVDDNKPMFVRASDGSFDYEFIVKENNVANYLIGKIVAEDPDEGENAKIYYYIIKGNDNNMFSLDRRDGSIRVLDVLDRERNNSYEFYVKATNNANYNSAANEIIAKGDPTIAHIRIIVEDENDNAPYFTKDVYYAGVNADSNIGTTVAELTAIDLDKDANGEIYYVIQASNLYKSGSNESSGSVSPNPFSINSQGKVTTAVLISAYNQDRFEIHVKAVENAPPNREVTVFVNVWVYQIEQLVRVILSRPLHEVKSKVHKIVNELANVTGNVFVVDEVSHHIDTVGQVQRDWCDVYMHMIDNNTKSIVTTSDVLQIMDNKYDDLKNEYADFAIENILPAYTENTEQPFEPALAALVALTIVLIVGCASVLILCCCFRHWIVLEPLDLKCDMLIKKPIIDDLSTTENPLWIEQKLKLYEEQELTMQVFCEPEANRLPVNTTLDRRGSDETSVVDNTYATIQQAGRRNSINTMLSMGPGDYATLGGSVLPLDKTSSHSQQIIEAALGFQGCTFQVPEVPADTTELLRVRSELRMNKDGQPEFVSELI